MVGSGVWVVVGLWLKWVVAKMGCGSSEIASVWVRRGWVWCFTQPLSHLSLWIGELGLDGGLGLVDGGFETVDLLISGWIGLVDHR